jgi:hypothetical protein
MEDLEGQRVTNSKDKGTGIDDHRNKAVGPSNRGFMACHVMNSQELPLNDH